MANKLLRKWSIEKTVSWNHDFAGLVGRANIALKTGNKGSFQFGAVDCNMDCGIETLGIELINSDNNGR